MLTNMLLFNWVFVDKKDLATVGLAFNPGYLVSVWRYSLSYVVCELPFASCSLLAFGGVVVGLG